MSRLINLENHFHLCVLSTYHGSSRLMEFQSCAMEALNSSARYFFCCQWLPFVFSPVASDSMQKWDTCVLISSYSSSSTKVLLTVKTNMQRKGGRDGTIKPSWAQNMCVCVHIHRCMQLCNIRLNCTMFYNLHFSIHYIMNIFQITI
nr:uncharacterized protein LOC129526221 [Gorilla gorilla gorilla]